MTSADKQKLIAKHGKCAECGSTENLTVDHIIPLSRGGTNAPENLSVLCVSCNKRKGNRINWGWLERIMIALHVDEHCQKIKNELKSMIAIQYNQLKDQFSRIAQSGDDKIWIILREKERQIFDLRDKLEALESHLKIEYVSTKEVIEFKGYKKKK